MFRLTLFLMTFCGGIAATIQPSVNARLAQKIGVIESACVSFAVGTIVLLIIALSGGGSFKGLYDAEWWELTGGFLGAFFVVITTLVVPRIGTTGTMVLIIAAQLIVGMLMDHFGLFGFRGVAIDLKRLAGVGLLGAGIVLILKS
ncbi:EamA-like transporter family protein [Desulfonema ishimotonii]|uniref:EamA-like transporter family protein n=1 Tax=Desulfonema ishimotonii TaxID=45657 RepID=A0A401FYR2_9BACT|nr:DMT family transporter [Desulfonema ishimotonii]GBC62097.1 EamA-like transporter family protein [Desulfonema ishimotonii]